MEIIKHRINTIAELQRVPKKYGIEVDIRDENTRLILQHDPHKSGDYFGEYLHHYNHGTIILNVKSEGIELEILNYLKKYKISNYFFLDSSFPMINRLIELGEKNIALRFSEFEPIENLIVLKNKVRWVWVDYFHKSPLNDTNYELIKEMGYKICIVSPELQSHQLQERKKLRSIINDYNIEAICTKIPKFWEE